MKVRLIAPLLLGLLIGSVGDQANGQERIIDKVGTHQVKSGETLEKITERYLGDRHLWRDNWKLNPQVKDPNKLKPGQVLNIVLERTVIAENARVNAVSNKVDKNLQRTNWQPASSGDELEQRDGVRTLRASSAELQFNDNSVLRLSEYSQIFLETKETTNRGVDRGRIEVREGAAELVFEPISTKRTRIELVTGNSVATAEADSSGRGQLRTANGEGGRAQVMVYEGRSQVAAAGAQVDVPRGYGTAVPEAGPPAPPEKLLAAPANLRAAPGPQWRVANEIIRWQPVDKAIAYIVEICRDRACGDLVMVNRVDDTKWHPQLKHQGEFFARVSAMSAAELQGYASESLSFSLNTGQLDLVGPTVVVVPIGFHQARDGDWLVGPGTRLRLLATDDGVGVNQIEYRWGQGPWHTWQGQDLPLPERLEPLSVRANDHMDRSSVQVIQLVAAPAKAST